MHCKGGGVKQWSYQAWTMVCFSTNQKRKPFCCMERVINHGFVVLQLVVHWTLKEGVSRQFEALREGFESVFSLGHVNSFYAEEVRSRFCSGPFCPSVMQFRFASQRWKQGQKSIFGANKGWKAQLKPSDVMRVNSIVCCNSDWGTKCFPVAKPDAFAWKTPQRIELDSQGKFDW